MEIPDELLCLFTGRIEADGDGYVVEIPENEIETGDADPGEVYRVALLSEAERDDGGSPNAGASVSSEHPDPPVEAGDVRTVEIEGLGDQGDGIARVDRGYVVIVPGTDVGDEVDVEIEEIRRNFAMARVVEAAAEE